MKKKLKKVTFYLMDINDNDFPSSDIKVEIDRCLDDYGMFVFEEIEETTVDCGEDFDTSKWNSSDTPIEEYRKEFVTHK